MKKTFISTSLALTASFIIAGCSSSDLSLPDNRIDYRAVKSGNPLELPPDLVGNTADTQRAISEIRSTQDVTLSAYAKQSNSRNPVANVLPQYDDVRMERMGDQRYLIIKAEPDRVWKKTMQFFQDNGLGIEKSDPNTGIIETVWAENRADIPESFIRNLLKKAMDSLYSSPTRDKFKARLERHSQSETAIYLTHTGMVDQESGSDGEFHTWVMRPRDPEIEAEMLARLMTTLGGDASKAKALAQVQGGSETTLQAIIQNNTLRANRSSDFVWMQVGNVMDTGSYQVESMDAAQRSYVVVWRDPAKAPSRWQKAAFWRNHDIPAERFTVSVADQTQGKEQYSLVTVSGLDNSQSDDIQALLTRIQSHLY